jgi:hypothetical protein
VGGDIDGNPNQLGQTLTVCGTAGVRFDTLQQRHGRFGALKIDFLEASEQLQAFEHHTTPPLSRGHHGSETLMAWCNGFKKGSQAGLSEVQKEMGPRLTAGKTIVKGGLELPQFVQEAFHIAGNEVKCGNGKSLTLGPTSW